MSTVTTTTPVPPLQPTSSATAKPNSETAPSELTVVANSKAAINTSASSESVVKTASIATLAIFSGNEIFSVNKVNEIKQAIAEGRFQIDSEKIADTFIEGVIDLLNAQQHSSD